MLENNLFVLISIYRCVVSPLTLKSIRLYHKKYIKITEPKNEKQLNFNSIVFIDPIERIECSSH